MYNSENKFSDFPCLDNLMFREDLEGKLFKNGKKRENDVIECF